MDLRVQQAKERVGRAERAALRCSVLFLSSCPVVPDSPHPDGLWPARLLRPWTSQARILKGAAISFSRGSSRTRDRTCVSCLGRRVFCTEPQGSPVYTSARGRQEPELAGRRGSACSLRPRMWDGGRGGSGGGAPANFRGVSSQYEHAARKGKKEEGEMARRGSSREIRGPIKR